MLVYYSGLGYWCRQVELDDFELLEFNDHKYADYNHFGVFELITQNASELVNIGSTDVQYLKPCTSHQDGALPKKYNEIKNHETVFFRLIDKERKPACKQYVKSDIVDQNPSVAFTHGNTAVNAKHREEVLGAALSVLAAFPEQCKSNEGKIMGSKIKTMIEEKAPLFWPDTQESPLKSDGISRLVNEWLKKTVE